jgi:hypothetical protein
MTVLRVGVICEGPTDFHAISQFMAAALAGKGIVTKFIDIQPDMGRSYPEAGWGNVELWLRKNPPTDRIRRYFDGGAFQRNMSAKACDVLLIQMDSDILDDGKFHARLRNAYGLELADATEARERGLRIIQVLELWSDLGTLTDVDRNRHVLAPAVESTETWCVSAFDNRHSDPEALSGQELVVAFMTALDTSESRPPKDYAEADKQPPRREKFCQKHAAKGAERIMHNCPHFARAVERLGALAT